MTPLAEVAALFLKLGFTAFGGPAAHIGIMHDEVVTRRKWLTDQAFLDLLGATNLIPGPNSTEMAIHIGYLRAGWPGLIAGGLCFLCPAALMVLGLAWLYVRYGSTPQLAWLLVGITLAGLWYAYSLGLRQIFPISGDAMGMPTEFLTPEQIAEYYGEVKGFVQPHPKQIHARMPAGHVTDDTGQALALANLAI